MSKEIFMLLGAPCSGKGTQCRLLQNKKIIHCVSVGDMLRKKFPEGTLERQKIDNGEMVKADEVVKMMEEYIESVFSSENKILIDGFPRSEEQARDFVYAIQARNMKKNMNISLNVILLDTDNRDGLLYRALTRQYCTQCQRTYDETAQDCCGIPLSRRKDDTKETFIKRYDYHEAQKDVICRTIDSTFSINAMNGIMENHKIITSIITQ